MTSLIDRLIASCPKEWEAYTQHDFLRQLAAGTLPEASFQHYLRQDYVFLIHFARCYALAAYKGDDLEDMRAAAASMHGILNTEMKLHIGFCEGWGISEAEMAAEPESKACMAYTRFVLERGMAGDILDLHVALAPCIIGYGVIGKRLATDPKTKRAGNPYDAWIGQYAGEEYQHVVSTAAARLDRLAERRLTEARFPLVAQTFAQACRLEADFWQMGLERSR